jgi:hypothetical protein
MSGGGGESRYFILLYVYHNSLNFSVIAGENCYE